MVAGKKMPVQYASNGDAQIAYRLIGGDGPRLITIAGTVPELAVSQHPMARPFYDRIGDLSQCLIFDPRGCGRSDPAPVDGMTTELAVADALALLDAAGWDRASVFGSHSGGLTAIALAATHPERVDRLVLANAWARNLVADDTPWGITPEFSDWLIERHRQAIGTGELFADIFVASRRGDPLVRDFFEQIESEISRAQAVVLTKWSQEADVRDLLPQIAAPTLVIQTKDNPVIPREHGRYLAANIVDSTYRELPGVDHAFIVSSEREQILDEVETFLTGSRPMSRTNRVFACVMFSDIVGSTSRASAAGDARWRTLLDDHDRVSRDVVEQCGGTVVKSTGDGVLAIFDSPSRAAEAASLLVRQLEVSNTPVRAGLHAGEIERRDGDVAGLAVHLAQRVCDRAGAGEVWASRGYPDLVLGSGLAFDDRGVHDLKGLDQPMQLWAID